MSTSGTQGVEIERDVVFAALVRPQTLLGVSYSMLIINLIVSAELFLVFRSIAILVVTAVVHVVAVSLSREEPRVLDIWMVRLRCCPRVPNHRAWRCNSYRP